MANRSWLTSLFGSRRAQHVREPQFELVVLEGAHAGECFPLHHDRMLIGRRTPDPSRPQEICLSDRSVSLRQATLEIKRGRVFIEHLPGATNHTIVNRRKVSRKKLKPGDIIVLGLVILELRETTQTARRDPTLSEPERTTTLAPSGEGALESRPEPAPGVEADAWLPLEPPVPSDEKTALARSPAQPAAPPASGHQDDTVIAEPHHAEHDKPRAPADTPSPDDEAATLVRPPPTPLPSAGHEDETVIAEPNDTKPES